MQYFIAELLPDEKIFRSVVAAVDTMEATIASAYEGLRNTAKKHNVGPVSGLFMAAYIPLNGPSYIMPAISRIFNSLSSGFLSFEMQEEYPKRLVTEMAGRELNHGQLYFILLVFRYRPELKMFYQPILRTLNVRWRSLPYHLKLELLDVVNRCYNTDEERTMLISCLQTIHHHTKDPWISTEIFEALDLLGALEDDAQAHIEVASAELDEVFSEEDVSLAAQYAVSFFDKQFDHPYASAYWQTLENLDEINRKRFYTIALQHRESSIFTVTLVSHSEKILQQECCMHLGHHLSNLVLDQVSPWESLKPFLLTHLIFAKYGLALEKQSFEEDGVNLKVLRAGAEVLYWLNRQE